MRAFSLALAEIQMVAPFPPLFTFLMSGQSMTLFKICMPMGTKLPRIRFRKFESPHFSHNPFLFLFSCFLPFLLKLNAFKKCVSIYKLSLNLNYFLSFVTKAELPVESIPQIVLLTFDDSVNDLNKGLYADLFERGRVNPNGCPISATFYVSHEWTDYSQVQNLYSDGHEMASHTVS